MSYYKVKRKRITAMCAMISIVNASYASIFAFLCYSNNMGFFCVFLYLVSAAPVLLNAFYNFSKEYKWVNVTKNIMYILLAVGAVASIVWAIKYDKDVRDFFKIATVLVFGWIFTRKI